MSTFEKLAGGDKKRPAARTFKLQPEFFTETWGRRPTGAFDVGLRVPGEQDYRNALAEAETAQSDAIEKALKEPVDRTDAGAVERLVKRAEEIGLEAYNYRLITFCVARGVCNPLNVTLPHPYFELADDEIPLALKSNAIKRIFDEIERLAVDQSPVFVEASDEDLLELAELLTSGDAFEGVNSIARARCLRYLKLVLDTLRE